jgi:hypothetical protein
LHSKHYINLCYRKDYEIKEVKKRLWENDETGSPKVVIFVKIYNNDKIQGVDEWKNKLA